MTILIPIAMYGWIAVVLALFASLSARRAVLIAFLGAWLFLPQAAIPFQGLPDLTRITVTSFSVLLGVVMFDAGRLSTYKFSWVDLPMLVYCICPMMSSLTNDLGAYDGLSTILGRLATWGAPYFIGRLYFNDLQGLRELAVAIFIGGLIYVPLCLIEVRMSPQMHTWVYGDRAFSFVQALRWGGYRPTVFMQHGLMVALWMISTTLVGTWLWASGSLRVLWNIPVYILVGAIFITSVLCKSTGALLLLVGGIGILFCVRYVKTPLLVLAIVLAPPAYLVLRMHFKWDGQELVAMAEHISEERAYSLSGRFINEGLLVEKAFLKPLWGYGSWGYWRIYDERGNDITVSDSLWIISLGQSGLVGLISMTTALLLPVLLFMRRVPVRHWLLPATGPPAALAVILILYLLDGLANAMLNPIFVLAAGGLSGFYVLAPALRARAMRSMRMMYAMRMRQRLAMQAAAAGSPPPQ